MGTTPWQYVTAINMYMHIVSEMPCQCVASGGTLPATVNVKQDNISDPRCAARFVF